MSNPFKMVFIFSALCLMALSTRAQSSETLAPQASELDQGSQELNGYFGDATPAGNQAFIRHEAQNYCNEEGLCKIYGVKTETDTQWELTFSIGEGTQTNGQQNVYYIGGGSPYGNQQNAKYMGAVLKVLGPHTCVTTIEIDYSVFRLIKTYMLNNIKSDGKSARDFTEAEKTVMMFYGKIIEKAATCQNSR